MLVEQLTECRSSSALSVSPCSTGPSLVVVIGGEADWTTAVQLREELVAALAYGPRSAVLDLTDLEFCSLVGMRAILAAVEVAERAGVDVTLHGASPRFALVHDFLQEARRDYRRRCRSGIRGSGVPRAATGGVPLA